MAENSPSLGKETDIQIQGAYGVISNVNPKTPSPRHTMVKLSKVKEIILKAASKNQFVMYK